MRAKKSPEMLPMLLMGLGVLLVISALVWLAVETGQTSVANTPTQASPGSAGQAQNPGEAVIPDNQVPRVELTEAKAAFDSKSAVFVDVRDPASYQLGHIPGAVNIPVSQIETRFQELKSDQWIITYCT